MKNKYLTSIEDWVKKGNIKIYSLSSDKYSHFRHRTVMGKKFLSGFNDYNTRECPENVIKLAEELSREMTESLFFLELGSGVGRGCHSIRENLKKEWVLDTLSLTPFSPDIKVKQNGRGMTFGLLDFLKKNEENIHYPEIEEQLEFYWWMSNWKVNSDLQPYDIFTYDQKISLVKEACSRPWGISFDTAFLLNEKGYAFFDLDDSPVRFQFIGELLKIIDKIEHQYHLIYDNWGALHYTLKFEDDEEKLIKLVNSIIEKLFPGGFLWMEVIRKNKLSYFEAHDNIQIQLYKTSSEKLTRMKLTKLK